MKPQSIAGLVKLIPALRRGDIQHNDQVLLRRGRNIDIETVKSMVLDTDGELLTRTPAHFTVSRKALTVIVPRDYRSEDEA